MESKLVFIEVGLSRAELSFALLRYRAVAEDLLKHDYVLLKLGHSIREEVHVIEKTE